VKVVSSNPSTQQKPVSAVAKRPLLSLIVPVKDEEDAIQPFLARVAPVLDTLRDPNGDTVLWEILFVDDGSSDATLAAIMAANRTDPRGWRP